jgi:rod shape-determining protein MreD
MKGVRDVFALIVVLVLQSTVLYRFEIGGIRPDLLVAYVIYFGWMRGPIPGTLGGFGIGLLQDLDASGPLGLNALAKSVVGFLVAKAGFRVHRSNIAVRFAFFFTAMLVHDVIYYGVATGGDGGEFMKQFFLRGVPTAAYTTIFTILLLGIAEQVAHVRLLADET